MNFVLFHMGNNLPEHIKYCIKQIEYTNPNHTIYFITNLNTTGNKNIQIINTNNLNVADIGSYYQNDAMSYLFRNAMLRIFYLNAFIEKYNMEDVVHFDNDVLIYENVDSIKDALRESNFLITPSNDKDYVYGFSYFKNNKNLNIAVQKLKELIIVGEKPLEQKLGTMPHEMRLTKYVNELSDFKLMDLFPIIPNEIHGINYNKFGMCFDPLPYGQFLGGLPAESHHYIGQNIINKKMTVKFENKKPIGIYEGKEFKICNLHIWNKNLKGFISYE